MSDKKKFFLKSESGATAMEYGLISALVGTALIGGLTLLGENAGTTFDKVASAEASGGSGGGSGSGSDGGSGSGGDGGGGGDDDADDADSGADSDGGDSSGDDT